MSNTHQPKSNDTSHFDLPNVKSPDTSITYQSPALHRLGCVDELLAGGSGKNSDVPFSPTKL